MNWIQALESVMVGESWALRLYPLFKSGSRVTSPFPLVQSPAEINDCNSKGLEFLSDLDRDDGQGSNSWIVM
jgi:hypothetical protein